MIQIIHPLRPKVSRGWLAGPPVPPAVSLGYSAESWQHLSTGLCVISAVEVARDGDGIDRGPEYHLSISLRGRRRCSSQDAQQVLRDFGLDGAEEDNHVPGGFVRNFWRPVADRFVGMECACKASEPAVVEDRGDFVWRGAPAQEGGR